MTVFGRRLRQFRLLRGKTRDEVADAMGVTSREEAAIEDGTIAATPAQMALAVDFLDMDEAATPGDGGGGGGVDGGGGGGDSQTIVAQGPAGTEPWLVEVSNPEDIGGGGSGDGLTDDELRAAPVPVEVASLPLPSGAATEATLAEAGDTLEARFGRVAQGDPVTITTDGDTDVFTPSPGLRPRLKWVWFSRKGADSAASVLVTVRIGSTDVYAVDVDAPDKFAHSVVREGAVDEKITINCDIAPGSTAPLRVNIDAEDF